MSTWIVHSESTCVAAEGTDWLDALASSLPHFKVPPGSLEHMKCSLNLDGSVDVQHAPSNLHLTVAALESVRGAEWARNDAEGAQPWPDARPIAARPLADGTDALFERCAAISTASDIAGAASIALALARDFVPAESGAVLVSTRNASRLQFVAAFGPKANVVMDTMIPINSGIAGFINNFPTGTIIRDVQRDCRFETSVDRNSGYETKTVLAVPIYNQRGPCFGCLELLNAPRPFRAHDLGTAQVIASALAAWFLIADV